MTEPQTTEKPTRSTEDAINFLLEQSRWGNLQAEFASMSAAIRAVLDRQETQEREMLAMQALLPGRAISAPEFPQTPSSAITSVARLAEPERYEGDPETCATFLLQCGMYLANQPPLSDIQKVIFIIYSLMGYSLMGGPVAGYFGL